jgi:hypothetical protein
MNDYVDVSDKLAGFRCSCASTSATSPLATATSTSPQASTLSSAGSLSQTLPCHPALASSLILLLTCWSFLFGLNHCFGAVLTTKALLSPGKGTVS